MYEYNATCVSVYDGDTITVDLDLGFNTCRKGIKIRLFGINTPEIRGGTEATKEAGRRSRDWLKEKILGKEIILKTYKDKKGKYGRWLGEIFFVGKTDEESLNNQMVNLGLAEVANY